MGDGLKREFTFKGPQKSGPNRSGSLGSSEEDDFGEVIFTFCAEITPSIRTPVVFCIRQPAAARYARLLIAGPGPYTGLPADHGKKTGW